MSGTTKVGIIGAGWPGQKHAEGYRGAGGFQIVAVADLMYVAKSLATEAYRPLETYSVVALIYFALSLPISRLVHVIERRQQSVVVS